MENDQDILDNPIDSLRSNQLSIKSKNYLSEIARWSKFLAIVGFVMVGLMALGGLFAGVIFSSMAGGMNMPMESGMIGGVYVVIAIIYFFPVLYLYRFSSNMKQALITENSETIDNAFENLKSHYKFIGIFMVITLALYGVGLIVALLVGLFA